MIYVFKKMSLYQLERNYALLKIIVTISASSRSGFFPFGATGFLFTVKHALRTVGNQGTMSSGDMVGE